jgi:hypothetical protein
MLRIMGAPPPIGEVASQDDTIRECFLGLDAERTGAARADALLPRLALEGLDPRWHAFLQKRLPPLARGGRVAYADVVRETARFKRLLVETEAGAGDEEISDTINDAVDGGAEGLALDAANRLADKIGSMASKRLGRAPAGPPPTREESAARDERDAQQKDRSLATLDAVGSIEANATLLGGQMTSIFGNLGHLAGTLRQVAAHLQVVTQLDFTLNIDFPDEFQRLYRWFTFVNLDFFKGLVSINACSFAKGFREEFFAHLAMLPALGLITLLVYGYYACRKSRNRALPYTSRSAWSAGVKAFNFVVFFMYPGLSTRCFLVFNCFDVNGREYLLVDPSVECDWSQSAYFSMVVGAVAGIVVYVLGIPLVYARTLYAIRRRLINPLHMTEREKKLLLRNRKYLRNKRVYGSLFLQYKRQYWYYELVEMVRKALLTGFVSVAGGPVMRAGYGTLVAGIFIVVACNCRPFHMLIDDMLQQGLQIVLFFVFFSGLLMEAMPEGRVERESVGKLLLMMNVAVLAFGLVCMLAVFPAFRRRVLEPLIARWSESKRQKEARLERWRRDERHCYSWTRFARHRSGACWINDATGDVSYVDPSPSFGKHFANVVQGGAGDDPSRGLALRPETAYERGCDAYFGRAGEPRSSEVAVVWFRKAAEAGCADAQIALAGCCANGQGVARDLDEAQRWCRRAAEGGDARARENLELYAAEAVRLKREAASDGAEAAGRAAAAAGRAAALAAAALAAAKRQRAAAGPPAEKAADEAASGSLAFRAESRPVAASHPAAGSGAIVAAGTAAAGTLEGLRGASQTMEDDLFGSLPALEDDGGDLDLDDEDRAPAEDSPAEAARRAARAARAGPLERRGAGAGHDGLAARAAPRAPQRHVVGAGRVDRPSLQQIDQRNSDGSQTVRAAGQAAAGALEGLSGESQALEEGLFGAARGMDDLDGGAADLDLDEDDLAFDWSKFDASKNRAKRHAAVERRGPGAREGRREPERTMQRHAVGGARIESSAAALDAAVPPPDAQRAGSAAGGEATAAEAGARLAGKGGAGAGAGRPGSGGGGGGGGGSSSSSSDDDEDEEERRAWEAQVHKRLEREKKERREKVEEKDAGAGGGGSSSSSSSDDDDEEDEEERRAWEAKVHARLEREKKERKKQAGKKDAE